MSITTTHTVFEKVTLGWTKTVPCTLCGRKVRRSKTFWQTLNPWNRDANGNPRTRAEIRVDLVVTAKVWQALPETHTKCIA